MKKQILITLLILCCGYVSSQNVTKIPLTSDEYWWGGVVALGSHMPYVKPLSSYDLGTRNDNNQVVPLLLSNKGRYVWSDYPFTFEVTTSDIIIRSEHGKMIWAKHIKEDAPWKSMLR